MNSQGEFLFCLWHNKILCFPFPWIAGFYPNIRLSKFCFLSDHQMGIDGGITFTKAVFPQGCNQTDQIRGAAGACIPSRPCRERVPVAKQPAGHPRLTFQGIDIKILLPVHLHSADGTVIQFFLDNVCISAVHIHFQHMVRKKYHCYGGAGLCICHVVRQFIVSRKGFPF